VYIVIACMATAELGIGTESLVAAIEPYIEAGHTVDVGLVRVVVHTVAAVELHVGIEDVVSVEF